MQYKWDSPDGGGHHSFFDKKILKILSSFLNEKQKMLSLLDIGCGNGYLSKKISKLGFSVTGIDPSESGILFAKSAPSDVNFYLMGDSEVQFNSLGKFDLITSFEVIEHLFTPSKLFDWANICLKEDGIFIVSTPFHGYFKWLAISLLGKTDAHVNPLWDVGHIKFFSNNTFKILANRHGFSIIKIDYIGRFFPLSKSAVYILQKKSSPFVL